MAVISFTRTSQEDRRVLVTWETVTDSDTCEGFPLPAEPEVSVMFTGDFAGGAIALEGSMDDTTDVALTDTTGTAIAPTADAVLLVGPHTLYIRPATPDGAGADIDVSLLVVAKGR